MMRAIFFLLLFFLGSAYGAENVVLRVHSEGIYRVEYKSWKTGFIWKKDIQKSLRKGSGFYIKKGKNHFIITAAHVVVGNWPLAEITIGKTNHVINNSTEKLASATFLVRIGDTSVNPKNIAIFNDDDVAIMEITPADASVLEVAAQCLNDSPVTLGQKVRAWGFPGTASPQLSKELDVSSKQPGFFDVNDKLDPGQSGGPVLDADGDLIGLVSRSGFNQTRIISAERIAGLLDRFGQVKVKYFDVMNVDGAISTF